MNRAEQQLRWGAAWWIGHAAVGFGATILATAIFGKKAQLAAVVLALAAHHALDTPVAVKLYQQGL